MSDGERGPQGDHGQAGEVGPTGRSGLRGETGRDGIALDRLPLFVLLCAIIATFLVLGYQAHENKQTINKLDHRVTQLQQRVDDLTQP